MKQKLNLSERLQAVGSFLPRGALFADIGTDHAHLPCHICLHDSTARAIAGDVNEGPLQRARENVAHFGLESSINIRSGNGLSIIQNGEADQIVISGMGGSLITTILEEGKSKAKSAQRIIAQPNVDAKSVRKWFAENEIHIVREALIEENGHYYEIIAAENKEDSNKHPDISERALLFGPYLLRQKTPAFYRKWRGEYEKLQKIIHRMTKAKQQDREKLAQFKTELHWMEEVLQGEKTGDQ